MGIVDGDMPVTFSVDEENLKIAETNVIVNLASIEYTTPGENYIGELVIELVEEQ
jgi:hypothetical protein